MQTSWICHEKTKNSLSDWKTQEKKEDRNAKRKISQQTDQMTWKKRNS